VQSSRSLTILYDESCALCRRCRDWLLTQPCLVPVQLVAAGSPAARSRYGSLAPWLGKELVVVDDRGNAWVGPAAFVTCLWATARYRAISYFLARPSLAPLAERFFVFVSKRRDRFGRWVSDPDADCSWCDGVMVTRDPR
jgi:predicted DCC family thiol-disulfide oxidoreductase YuxK